MNLREKRKMNPGLESNLRREFCLAPQSATGDVSTEAEGEGEGVACTSKVGP
jgi:hypothetical protein